MFEVPMFVWVLGSVGYFGWAISRLISSISDARDQHGYREDSKQRSLETAQRTKIEGERWEFEKKGYKKKKK